MVFFQVKSTREDGSAILTIKARHNKGTMYVSATLNKEEVRELRNCLDVVLGQKVLLTT